MFQLRALLERRTKIFLVAASLLVLCFVSFSNVYKANSRLLTHLRPESKFMEARWCDLTPIVVKDFKFIMVTIPKVGCTQWNRLARVMMGEPHDLGQRQTHNPHFNGLSYLCKQ